MAFLTANGLALKLASFRELPRVVRGEAVRAFDNTMLDGTDAGMREWEGETVPHTPAEAAEVRATVAGEVVLDGEALDAPATCKVTVRDVTYEPARDPVTRQLTAHKQTLSLLFQEVG